LFKTTDLKKLINYKYYKTVFITIKMSSNSSGSSGSAGSPKVIASLVNELMWYEMFRTATTIAIMKRLGELGFSPLPEEIRNMKGNPIGCKILANLATKLPPQSPQNEESLPPGWKEGATIVQPRTGMGSPEKPSCTPTGKLMFTTVYRMLNPIPASVHTVSMQEALLLLIKGDCTVSLGIYTIKNTAGVITGGTIFPNLRYITPVENTTPYVLEITDEDGTVLSAKAYHTDHYDPPLDTTAHRLVARIATTAIIGWTSPYATHEDFMENVISNAMMALGNHKFTDIPILPPLPA
jgi:hypothetical protein